MGIVEGDIVLSLHISSIRVRTSIQFRFFPIENTLVAAIGKPIAFLEL